MTPTTTKTNATPSRIGPTLELRSRSASGDGSVRPPMRRLYYRERVNLLLAADREPVDSDCWTRHGAAELKVVSDLGDIEEHFLQIAGYRDFFHGIGQFSTGNPEPGSAPRIVAGHQVCSVPEKFGHVKTVWDLRDNLLRRLRPRLQEVISGTDSRRSRQSPRSVAGSLEAELFRTVCVQQIGLEHTVIYHDGAP